MLTNENNVRYVAPPAYVVENDNSKGFNVINGVKHQHHNDYSVWIGEVAVTGFAFKCAADAWAFKLNRQHLYRFRLYYKMGGKNTACI